MKTIYEVEICLLDGEVDRDIYYLTNNLIGYNIDMNPKYFTSLRKAKKYQKEKLQEIYDYCKKLDVFEPAYGIDDEGTWTKLSIGWIELKDLRKEKVSWYSSYGDSSKIIYGNVFINNTNLY